MDHGPHPTTTGTTITTIVNVIRGSQPMATITLTVEETLTHSIDINITSELLTAAKASGYKATPQGVADYLTNDEGLEDKEFITDVIGDDTVDDVSERTITNATISD